MTDLRVGKLKDYVLQARTSGVITLRVYVHALVHLGTR